MKQALCILCALALLICCGCNAVPGQDATTTVNTTAVTTESTQADVTASIPEQKPMVSVGMPVITEETKAQDGTVLFQHTYQNMELIIPDPDVADAVILDYLTRTDGEESAAELADQAINAYKNDPENWVTYLAQTTYSPERIDSGVLSLFGSDITFTGGAHADAVYRSVSYDLVTGEVISLTNFLTDDISADELSQLVIEALTAQKQSKGIWDGFEDTVKSRFSGSYENDKDWYFSTTGLCFFFPPYEISPYASGVIVAEIPYEKLAGKANDAYFPTELESAYGTLNVTAFEKADLTQYTQISELLLSEEGEKALLHTQYSVHNLKVELGQWSADGKHFVPQYTVLAALSLTPGDAIVIGYEFTQTLPAVRVVYSNQDGLVQEYITLDHANDSIILTQ